MRTLGLPFCAFLVALFLCASAHAHSVGLSTGEYTAHASTLVGRMAFARNEVASLAPNVDRNADGHITAVEVSEAKDLLTAKILGRIQVTQKGVVCPPTLDDAGLTEQDGMLLTAHWSCAASDQPFDVTLLVLDDLARGHRHIARAVSGEKTEDQVLFGDQRSFVVPAAPADVQTDSGSSKVKKDSSPSQRSGFGGFLLMGIEHILSGYDHLVFIFGLVLIRARLRQLLAIITAFTVAHSITLAVAVLGIWTPSPRIVEPAIALSIAYVGIDNLRLASLHQPNKRWKITFPFGLIHGFGFAAALHEVGLTKAAIPIALVAFNLGVEMGQLGVLAVLLPIVFLLRKATWFEPRGVRALSFVVTGLGLVWFVLRVVSPS